eukprot:3867494-Prymnesium_polylepis.1
MGELWGVVPRRAAAEKDVQHHASRPHVDAGVVACRQMGHMAQRHDLRGHVEARTDLAGGACDRLEARTMARRGERLLLAEDLGEPEIGHLDVPAVGRDQEDVLGFDVPVDDAVRVHEGQHREELADHVYCDRLGERAAGHDSLKQLASLGALQHNVQRLRALQNFDQLDDLRVLKLSEQAALVPHASQHREFPAIFEHDLHRERFASRHVGCVTRLRGLCSPLHTVHRGKGAASELRAKLVHALKVLSRVDDHGTPQTLAQRGHLVSGSFVLWLGRQMQQLMTNRGSQHVLRVSSGLR